MLIRDPMSAGPSCVANIFSNPTDQPHIFLLDCHPVKDPGYCLTPVVIGFQEGRWLSPVTLTPDGPGSEPICASDDPQIQCAYVSNRLARESMRLERRIEKHVIFFYQQHIRTAADVAKLNRYLNRLKQTA